MPTPSGSTDGGDLRTDERPRTIVRGRAAGDLCTPIRRAALQDQRLSYRARGILAAVLSQPLGRVTSATRIAVAGKEGREAVEIALKELARYGYLRRRRRQLANGRFCTDWHLTDDPEIGERAGHTGNGSPGIGKPGVGRPSSTGPDQEEEGIDGTATRIRALLPAGAHRSTVLRECRRLASLGWTENTLVKAVRAHDWTGAGGGAGIAWLRAITTGPQTRRRGVGRPAWCGTCDEATRTIDGPRRGRYATVTPCPTCHPTNRKDPS